jgi:cytochrome c553
VRAPLAAAVPAATLALALGAHAWAQQAKAPDAARGQQLVANGNPNGALPCGQCHGADGKGDPSGPYPRLAGQAALYLYKQLDDYASGTRKNEVMGPIAQALSDQERQDAAAYYAGQTAPYGEPSSPAKADLALGRRLATVGSADQRVQACGNCHGPAGIGEPPAYPRLAGQYASYAQAQLAAWKQGQRANDLAGVMREITGKLTDDEVTAVSAYMEQARPQGAPP